MKNYYAFIEDHSGSMDHLANIALIDSNANMQAIADSASKERLDTIVSVIALGFPRGRDVTRVHTISNPNVLKPATSWPCPGGTPLYDAIWNAIDLHEGLPDINSSEVSVVVNISTDGQEADSLRRDPDALRRKIAQLQATGRWTFVARIPKGARHYATRIGIPEGNILEWETSERGMRAATAASTAATQSFYAARSAGAKSSSAYFTTTAAVDTSKLTDITSEVSLYQVPNSGGTARVRIDDFILGRRSKFLKGAAFVQLVKTEAKIGPKKIVLIRERKAPNRIYAGKEAREMVGMPTDPTSNARVNPGDHGDYDIFIQSESLNRLLPDSVGVIYWEKQGVPFTQADIDLFAPKPAAAPAAPVLPAVVGRTKPTPSPVPKLVPAAGPDRINGLPVKFFEKRDDARAYARTHKLKKGSLQDADTLQGNERLQASAISRFRWYVLL